MQANGLNGFHSEASAVTPAPVVAGPAFQQAPLSNGNDIKIIAPQKPKTLYQKVLAVYQDVEYVQKDKKNTFHGYSYASEAAIKRALHAAFAAHGLILLPPEIIELQDGERETKTDNSGREKKGEFMTTLKVKLTIADADTGDKLEGTSYGRGQDSGEKGLYKALTGAIKYFLATTFMIATGDDPENDEDAGQQSKDSTRGRNARPQRQEPAPAAAAPAPPPPPATPPLPLSVVTRADFFGSNSAGRRKAFTEVASILPPDVFVATLNTHGVDKVDGFKSANAAWACYEKMVAAVRDQFAKQQDPSTFAHFVASEGDVQ